MAIVTVADARADLYASLNVPTVTTLVSVLAYEPKPGSVPSPGVTIFWSAADANAFTFSIRAYVDEGSGAEAAQDLLAAITAAIEEALSFRAGPRQWTIGYDDRIEALVAQSDVQIIREDF